MTRSGFAAAITSPDPRDLDRELTTSSFGFDANSFVAACYFVDEAKDQRLGPFHLIRFDRASGHWNRRTLDEPQGAPIGVVIGQRNILVRTTLTPSAGLILVLNQTLGSVATLNGFDPVETPDGVVLFRGNMRHFAPTHAETLWVFDGRSGTPTEIFPGPKLSTLAEEVRRRIVDTVERLPEKEQKEFSESNYGPPFDFDRTFVSLTVSTSGRTIAFVVDYDNYRLDGFAGLETLAVCRQGAVSTWSCQEETIADAARRLGVRVVDGPVEARRAAFEQLAKAAAR